MKYSQLVKILRDSGLSPEQIGRRMGLSGMTIRRWHKAPPGREVSEVDNGSLRDLIFALIKEGRVAGDAPSVSEAMYRKTPRYVEAVLAHLGVRAEHLGAKSQDESAVESLSQIGSQKAHVEEVTSQRQRIMTFKRKGREWADRLETLNSIVSAKDMHGFEKAVAFGALFYLLTPFDLVHDFIPVFGLVDDFAMLGLAVSYYAKRLPSLIAGDGHSVKVN